MNIDQIQGLRFPEVELVAEEILSPSLYAQAIESGHREYFSTKAAHEAGFPGRPIPPLAFFHTIDEAALLNVLGVKYGRTLAAGSRNEFGVLATERDTLVGQSFVESAYRRTGRDGREREFLVLVTEFRLADGRDLVSRSQTTFIEVVS